MKIFQTEVLKSTDQWWLPSELVLVSLSKSVSSMKQINWTTIYQIQIWYIAHSVITFWHQEILWSRISHLMFIAKIHAQYLLCKVMTMMTWMAAYIYAEIHQYNHKALILEIKAKYLLRKLSQVISGNVICPRRCTASYSAHCLIIWKGWSSQIATDLWCRDFIIFYVYMSIKDILC